jgi:hypothetical protein
MVDDKFRSYRNHDSVAREGSEKTSRGRTGNLPADRAIVGPFASLEEAAEYAAPSKLQAATAASREIIDCADHADHQLAAGGRWPRMLHSLRPQSIFSTCGASCGPRWRSSP